MEIYTQGSQLYKPVNYEQSLFFQSIAKYREGSCVALSMVTFFFSIWLSKIFNSSPIETLMGCVILIVVLTYASFLIFFKVKYSLYHAKYKEFLCCDTQEIFKSQKYHFKKLELLYFEHIFNDKCSIASKSHQIQAIILFNHHKILNSKGGQYGKC